MRSQSRSWAWPGFNQCQTSRPKKKASACSTVYWSVKYIAHLFKYLCVAGPIKTYWIGRILCQNLDSWNLMEAWYRCDACQSLIQIEISYLLKCQDQFTSPTHSWGDDRSSSHFYWETERVHLQQYFYCCSYFRFSVSF